MNASAIAGVAMAAAAAVPASFPKEAHDQPLNKDQFPATAYVNLCRAGYTTLGKLATATTAELLAIPGIGQQKVRHIDMVLALAGLRRSDHENVVRKRGRQPARVATKTCQNPDCQNILTGPWYTVKNRKFCSRACANNGMTRADGRDEEIRALFQSNVSVREIAAKYGITHQRVSQIVGRTDLKRPERACTSCGEMFTPNSTLRVQCDGCIAKRTPVERPAETPLDPALIPHLTQKGRRAAMAHGRMGAAAVAA